MSEKPAPYTIGNLITGIFKQKPLMIDGDPPPPYADDSVSSDSQNTDNLIDGRLILEVYQRTHGRNRKKRAIAVARKIHAKGRVKEYFGNNGSLSPPE